MKIQIENLKAQMQGRELNIHQKADALIEVNKLIDYVEELEQLLIQDVSKRSICGCGKPKVEHICQNCKGEINHS